jgi:hypothetical protein
MQRRVVLRSLLLSPLGAGIDAAWAEGRGVELAVVVAESSPLQELSLADLRRIFTSEPFSDPSGTRLVPLNHPPRTPDRAGFDRVVLGMEPDAVAKFWLDRRIRGQPGAPRTVDSLGILLKVVAKLPGAIGYVRPQYLREVRALKVEGALPGKPGYRLVFGE